jgi:hypothetical protein
VAWELCVAPEVAFAAGASQRDGHESDAGSPVAGADTTMLAGCSWLGDRKGEAVREGASAQEEGAPMED